MLQVFFLIVHHPPAPPPPHSRPTILDKTVEKIEYLDSIFLNIVAVPVLSSPSSPESNVVVACVLKRKPDPWAFVGSNIELGEGVFSPQCVVLEIVLLRRKVDMVGKTFSSSFVWDCRLQLFFI